MYQKKAVFHQYTVESVYLVDIASLSFLRSRRSASHTELSNSQGFCFAAPSPVLVVTVLHRFTGFMILPPFDSSVAIVLLTAPSLRSDSPPTFDNLSKALRGEAQRGDMVPLARLVSIVAALGFWASISVSLSLLIE
jgi:hypothetical protein